MPTYGLIVEGEYDAAALTELIRRYAEGNIQVIPRQCAQKGSLMKKFPAYLQELHWANQGQAVDKALVIRDAVARIQESWSPEWERVLLAEAISSQ